MFLPATQNLRDLFDHMGQAIVAFDRDGNVRGAVSRQATIIFGASVLEGRPMKDLLFAGASGEADVEAQAFVEWQALAFDVPLADWPNLADLAPKEVTLPRDGSKVALTLEFRPVAKDGAVERVMVLATDVSEKRRLEQTVATQEEQHAKRMTAMRKLVAGGAQLFIGFIQVARDRVARFFDLVENDADLDATGIDDMFRHVHTMKGEARAFDLAELEAALESLEDTLASLRRNAEALSDRELAEEAASAIRAGLFRSEAAIDRARSDFVAVSPIGSAALDQAAVVRSELESALALAQGRNDDLARAVSRLAARPFGESLATVAERVSEWAARDGKRVEIVIEGREVRMPPSLAAVLTGVMTHLVRNAVAHGIEPSAERAHAGKNPVGTIWASAQATAGGDMVIVVEDDGGGIDLERVAQRARDLGLDGSLPAADLIFCPGLSTRATSDGLAGRGVGLDAVRSYLREAGYVVQVVTEKGHGTKFVLLPHVDG
jgi:chemotaxis protein histidine kinase CheA